MKKLHKIGFILLVVSCITMAAPVGSRFSYQGQLKDNGSPANGLYDMRFKIYSVLSGSVELGVLEIDDVEVSNGSFNVELDFGDALFNGDELYLEIGVTEANFPGYFVLSPRQRINAIPYAIQAEFTENDTSPWESTSGGIGYNGNVKIGNITDPGGAKLLINADAGQGALQIKVGGDIKMSIYSTGGTSLGTNLAAPVNGLRVGGQAQQALTSHGFVKAGVFIQCAAGINGASDKFFNNVNGQDFTTTQNGAGGGCSITAPFDLGDVFFTVSAEHIGPFESLNASCSHHLTQTDKLNCQINRVSGSQGVTAYNGVIQILFY